MFVTETPATGTTTEPQPATDRSMDLLKHADRFARRHIGPNADDVRRMLDEVGFNNLDELIDAALPANIRLRRPLELPAGRSELGPASRDCARIVVHSTPRTVEPRQASALTGHTTPRWPGVRSGCRTRFGILNELRSIASKNQVFRSFIGLGYHDCITPPVI